MKTATCIEKTKVVERATSVEKTTKRERAKKTQGEIPNPQERATGREKTTVPERASEKKKTTDKERATEIEKPRCRERPTAADVAVLRMYVHAREDFQSMRTRLDNRIGRKANGEDQDIDERKWLKETKDLENFSTISGIANEQEDVIEKMLLAKLRTFPIYTDYLHGVKGVGTIASGWIIGEINIHRADTVSKIWQFCGMNPSGVRGKKDILKSKYKDGIGEIVREYTTRKGEIHVVYQTDEMVPGDRLSPGFVAPFNKRLRTALVGVLATSFIKAQAPYALDYYYTEHVPLARRKEIGVGRLDASEQICERTGKPWKAESEGHRDHAARRKMIKAFLRDLYVVWRAMEGLPVREPYQEQYLGHQHVG